VTTINAASFLSSGKSRAALLPVNYSDVVAILGNPLVIFFD